MSALDDLFAAAEAARRRAYAPYSRFQVGAAIRDPDGRIHAGCNVENAAYPIGTCAEAGALAAMVLAGADQIAEIAVVGGPEHGAEILCPPCGGCRQRIREFGGLTARVHLREPDGTVRTLTLDDLLPVSFGPEHL
ncbi:cytidine deaminase [Prosthecomicrobium sp. N25]|uniref:cytidine deaminase n=1 Tax=Prosthecomicrobium sp. N25 TaxID=3129254 RepID=UPI0030773BB5